MWAQCTLFKSPLTRINSPRNATSPRASLVTTTNSGGSKRPLRNVKTANPLAQFDMLAEAISVYWVKAGEFSAAIVPVSTPQEGPRELLTRQLTAARAFSKQFRQFH
jgi:hypothetical protein